MFSKVWLKDASERALSTVAQAALAFVTATGSTSGDLNLKQLVAVSLMAGVLSLLKSVAASGVGNTDSASLIDLEK